MDRFVLSLKKNLILSFKLLKKVLNENKRKRMAFEFKYHYLKKYIDIYFKSANIDLNIKNDASYNDIAKKVFVVSYKSNWDLLIAYKAINVPSTFALDYRRIKKFYNKQFAKFLEIERIDTTDLYDVSAAFLDIQREINENKAFIFQPQLEKNKEFNENSFKPIIKTKATIIPVVINNSNILDENLDEAKVDVNILKEIRYDEYKDLNKEELCNFVKEKMEDYYEKI